MSKMFFLIKKSYKSRKLIAIEMANNICPLAHHNPLGTLNMAMRPRTPSEVWVASGKVYFIKADT